MNKAYRPTILRYKGFDGYVTQNGDQCWGHIWPLNSVFHPESIEASQGIFEKTVEEAISYLRSLSSNELLDCMKKIHTYSSSVSFITYKGFYQDKHTIGSDIPNIECLEFINGPTMEKLPFLHEEEVYELSTQYPIHERKRMNMYLPNYEETVHFQIIPWKDIYNLIKHS